VRGHLSNHSAILIFALLVCFRMMCRVKHIYLHREPFSFNLIVGVLMALAASEGPFAFMTGTWCATVAI